MSKKEQPKKNKPEDDQSEDSSDQSAETPKDELSPGDDENKYLLSPPAAAGVSPVASGSGEGRKVTGMLKRCNLFGNKNPKKRRLSGSFSKAKEAFKKTIFRKSESSIQTFKPESEKHRKISDPTDYRNLVLQTGSESEESFSDSPSASTSKDPSASTSKDPSASTSKETKTGTEDEQRSKEPKSKGFFSHFYSSSKEAPVKNVSEEKAEAEAETKTGTEDEQRSKEPKSKGFFSHLYSSSKEAPVKNVSEEKAEAVVQKKPLSPRISKQSASSGVSVGFFNEGMLPSESSGVPTESTSVDTQDNKSGSSVSAESSRNEPSTRLSKAKDDDSLSSLSE